MFIVQRECDRIDTCDGDGLFYELFQATDDPDFMAINKHFAGNTSFISITYGKAETIRRRWTAIVNDNSC